MNRVTAIGRLTVDPELRSASSGKKVCSMRLVLARRECAGEDQGAVLVDVVAFEGLAVACASALGKGSKIVIDGRLEHRTWQGKDGSKRSRHEVIAHEVVFLDAPPPTAANGRRERRHEEPTSASPPDREPTRAAA
ncbi:MAG: single-stranded DNA-binding protein [Actinomycetota bacterium]|nr:single-stranded DNA-binding protein [Actinomycetota bacterium]